MGNFVAINFKYYKDSQAEGEIGHVMRNKFEKNTNAIESLTHENFGSDFDLIAKYKELLAFAKQNTKEKTGRAFQAEKANTFLDGVLVFSNEQMLEIKKDSDWKSKMSQHIEQFMLEIEQKTGFMPVGWRFHLDEGTMDENGNYKLNHHAQLIFMNHAKESGKAPLRDYQKRKGDSIWSELQTLAGERFKDLGFVRGVSAEETRKKHLEKDAFIKEKQKQISEGLQALQDNASSVLEAQRRAGEKLAQVRDKINALEALQVHDEQFNEKFTRLSHHVSRVKDFFEQLYNKNKSVRTIINAIKTAAPTKFEYSKNVVNNVLAFFGSDKPKLQHKEALKEIKSLFDSLSYDSTSLEEINKKLEELKQQTTKAPKGANNKKQLTP